MVTEEMLKEFVAAARKVGAAGLTACSSGNLSMRFDDVVLISASGSWLPELCPENVAVVDFESGTVLNGVKPSMESGFHLGVMKMRDPEIGCVLHFQSPYATAMSCLQNPPAELNFTAEIPIYVGKRIPLIPYYQPGSPELSDHVLEAMKDSDSVLLRKHGQVVCGRDFPQTFQKAVFFEMACRIYILTAGKSDPLTAEEIAALDKFIKK